MSLADCVCYYPCVEKLAQNETRGGPHFLAVFCCRLHRCQGRAWIYVLDGAVVSARCCGQSPGGGCDARLRAFCGVFLRRPLARHDLYLRSSLMMQIVNDDVDDLSRRMLYRYACSLPCHLSL